MQLGCRLPNPSGTFGRTAWMNYGFTPGPPATWPALFAWKAQNRGTTGCNYCVFRDAVPFIEEALALGVKQFSFTGGEPFINKDIIPYSRLCVTVSARVWC